MRSRPSIPFLLDLLRLALRKEASAVYLVPWLPPTLRLDDRSVPLSSVSFTPEQSTLLVLDVLDDSQRAALDSSREIHFSFELPELGRFRVHAFRRHGQPAMAIRPFAIELPTTRRLALPALACTAALAERGLLVLASRSLGLRRDAATALMEHRNRNGSGELAWLDGATRCWHDNARCQVHQGLDPGAVDELLRRRAVPTAAMGPAGPPAPLAIAWGELRDGPQLERVARCAEEALCLVTLNSDGLLATLQRLISLAAEHTGPTLLHRTAIALDAVLALRPVPALAGGHSLAATEAVLNSPALAASLAEGDLDSLRQLISGAAPGARASGADEHLWQLVAQGLVAGDDALRQAVDRDAFERRLQTDSKRPAPDATTAPVTVDTGFADLFDPAAPPPDPFAFADAPPPARAADTRFDSVEWAPETAPSQPAELRTAPRVALPTAAPAAGSVQFHAYAPALVVPGHSVVIDLWAALPEQSGEVSVLAQGPPGGASPATEADPAAPRLSAQLHIDGLLPAAPVQHLSWRGRPSRTRFEVLAPLHARPGAHAARVRVAVGGLLVGELSFVLQVVPNAAPESRLEDTQAARQMLQSAYAAFVPADRDAMQACVQALQAVAPGVDVFVDAPRLRSGERWRERIEHEAGRRERLFLFWSAAAAESPWIDFEWRLMMRRRGLGVIDAVLLDPPRLAPLPAELADQVPTEIRARPGGRRPGRAG